MTRLALLLVFVTALALMVVSAAFGSWQDPGGTGPAWCYLPDPFSWPTQYYWVRC